MTINILQQVNFGNPAAERDDDLIKCFVGNESYQKLLGGSKRIILGNRGMGKSALFKKLKDDQQKRGRIVISLSPDDYSYEMMSAVLAKEATGSWAKHGAYTVAWKYLIYMIAFRSMAKDGFFKTGKAAKVYEFVRDQTKDFEKNPIGLLISYLKRIEGVKVGKYEAGIKTTELQRLYKLDEIEDLVSILDEAAEKKPVIILVDELDKGWDASEDAKSFVSGLFSAGVSINSSHRNLSVVVSLRKELYENIPEIYEDAQKISDLIEIITWDETLLLELVGRRISGTVPGLEMIGYREQWNRVFQEVLAYRKSDSYNYIIDRTTFRPREMIIFCNAIVEIGRKNKATAPINYPTISDAEGKYSENRMHDIASEYKYQYPGLNSVFESFRGLRFNMTKDQFQTHAIEIALGKYKMAKEAAWVKDVDPDEIIKVLWDVGFIKAQVVGGVKAHRRSGSEWMGSYQISGIDVLSQPVYQVHPMFRAFLGMKEK